MADSPTLEAASLETFLAYEEASPDKHELFRGHVYSLAGGSANHGDIIVSLTGHLP